MRLTIPGEPVAKERPRKGQYGNFYTPRKSAQYEQMIGFLAMAQPGGPMLGPVSLTMEIYTGNRSLDVDNVIKSVCDGLNGQGYKDDKQVCELHVTRIWSDDPRVEVELEETTAQTED